MVGKPDVFWIVTPLAPDVQNTQAYKIGFHCVTYSDGLINLESNYNPLDWINGLDIRS